MTKWEKTLRNAFDTFMDEAKTGGDLNKGYMLLNKALVEWGKDKREAEAVNKMFDKDDEGTVGTRFEFVQDASGLVGIVLIARLDNKLRWRFMPKDNGFKEKCELFLANSDGREDVINCYECVRVLRDNSWLYRIYKVKDRNAESGIWHYFYGDKFMNESMNKELGIL